jgi:tetratricopeptide (TPR) repeat protein/predicted Ser/Thr protein kinase
LLVSNWSTDTHVAGRYRLERIIGQGGMGQVHAAHDTLLQRQVAIKTLGEDATRDPVARARLRREALAAAALDHPFICKVFEVGEHEGRDFIVMEYVEGKTLDAVIAERSVTPRQLLEWAHELAQALDEAHRRGLIHRDLKPTNIMVTGHDHVKVLDFGIAKQTRAEGADTPTRAQSSGATEIGTRLGTLSYMSPEQVLGSSLDPRSDVFSLGVVFHELASGRHPFRKDQTAETMAAILRDPPASAVTELDAVPGFGHIVHRMLAKACAERYQTMRELTGELDALRSRGSSITPRSGETIAHGLREERTQMVAREVELAELARQLDTMLLGQGGLVLLGGEPGVGKTRLAREILRLARARGCFTGVGQCYEQEGAPPFGPHLEIMDQALRAVPQAVRISLGDSASELSLLYPSLRRQFPDIPEPPAIPAEQQRTVVFNAYVEYLRRASSKSPLVVLLDDLHWADEPTLQLLLHAAPHLGTMRTLCIGTYRDVELDTARPFARTLETLLRQRLAVRVGVKRLGASGVQQMLTTMSGSAPPAALVKVVHAETDGNPFFVEEVFHHLKEDGKLFDADGQWKANLRVEDLDVPEGVRLVISRRLDRLGEAARKLLAAAAVIGRSFPLDLLRAISDAVDEDTVFDVVEQAERAQLLQAERGRDARYTFVHELIRGTLLGGMALPRRQRMHLRVADAIERLRAASLDAHVSVLAHHLYQAGAAADADRAVRVLSSAMQKAYAAGAFEEALELAERLSSYDLAAGSFELATVEQTKADVLSSLGRPLDALAAAGRAMALWERLGNDAGIVRATMLQGIVHIWQAQAGAALAVTKRGLGALSPGATCERASLEAACAGGLAGAGQFAEATALIDQAARTASERQDSELAATVASFRATMSRCAGRWREAAQHAEHALHLFGDSYSSVRGGAAGERLLALWFTGDYAALERALPENEALARRIGQHGIAWLVDLMEASLALVRTGDLKAWQRFNQGEIEKPFQWQFVSHWFSADAAFMMGDTSEALAEMRGAVEGKPDPQLWTARQPEVALFAMYAWAGDHDRARALWREVAAEMPTADGEHVFGRWAGVHTAIPALSIMGERDSCAALYPAVEASLAQGCVFTSMAFGPTTPLLSAAISAEAAGLPDVARRHYEDALRLVTTAPIRHVIPAAKLWFGRHLAGQGGDDRARGLRMLKDAQQEFSALGMTLHREHAERWLTDAERA